jgi:O-acetyl-ADP-ribose deacetylase (regulator of RNase III)
VHLPSGTVAWKGRVLGLTDGWFGYGVNLVHISGGVMLQGRRLGGSIGAMTPAVAGDTELLDMAREGGQLDRDDLLAWLAGEGVLTGDIPGVAVGAGWQQVTDVHGGQRWRWNTPGVAVLVLPPGFSRGTATAVGLRCLVDSLGQLMRSVLPPGQRDGMTTEFLAAWFERHLPETSEGYAQLTGRRMIDVWSVLPTFTSMFQVRVQLFRHHDDDPDARRGGAGGSGAEAVPGGGILASHLDGPPADQDGEPTPVLSVYWRGEHFEPLLLPAPAVLPERVPLGAGPPAVAAAVGLRRGFRIEDARITGLLDALPDAAAAAFREEVAGIQALWGAIDIAITPSSDDTVVAVLRDIYDRLASLGRRIDATRTPAGETAPATLSAPPIATAPGTRTATTGSAPATGPVLRAWPADAPLRPRLETGRGDLLRPPRPAGAIVNPTNPTMLGGGGVAGLISAAGGAALSAVIIRDFPILAGPGNARIRPTEARPTIAPGIAAQFVIHVLPPNFNDAAQQDFDWLRAAYRNAVAAADEALAAYVAGLSGGSRGRLTPQQLEDLATVNFPVLSGELYRGARPHEEILGIAIEELGQARTRFIRRINLVVYSRDIPMLGALAAHRSPGHGPAADRTTEPPAPRPSPRTPLPGRGGNGRARRGA